MTTFDGRAKSAAQLAADNEVLQRGTIVVENDTGKAKRHTGGAAYNDLPYWNPSGNEDASFGDVVVGELSGGGFAAAELLVAGGESVSSRELPYSNVAVLGSSGTVAFHMFTARRTETIDTVRTFSATTAAGATPTLCKVGVYQVAASGDLTRLAVSDNNTGLWATANTEYDEALLTSFSKVAGVRYAVAILVVTGAAMPTHQAVANASSNLQANFFGVLPKVSGAATGETDLEASYTNAEVLTTGSRQFAALLLP